MNIVAKIEGLDDLSRALKAAPRQTRELLRDDVISKTAEVAARVAKTNVPRETSDLYHAIGFDGRGLSWAAGIRNISMIQRARGGKADPSHINPSVYGRFVEYGTSDTAAHPFMRPAADGERAKLPSRLRAMAAKLPKAVR